MDKSKKRVLVAGGAGFIGSHLASPASPNQKNPRSYINHPIETLLANSLGTYNLLELARQFNAKFLYASSSEIYGDPAMSPQKEEYFGNVNPNGVRSVYDERTILDIARLIKSMTNSTSEIVFEDLPIDDPKARKPDISRAKRILGWEPKVTTEEGLQKTIDYFRKGKA